LTLVLAVRCAEGVVLGADSQSTDISGGNIVFSTRKTVQKLKRLTDHIAWGATGNEGLTQRFEYSLRGLDPAPLGGSIEDIRGTLAESQRSLQRTAIGEVVQGLPASQVFTVSPLFAGYTDGRPWILEVTAGGEDTVYDDYYAVGSGGPFAQAAMVSVAHYDVRNQNLDAAKVIVWRAIDGCIRTSAFGLGHPIAMCTVTAGGVEMLSRDDVRGVEDSVNAWKSAERDALGDLGLGDVVETAEPEDTGLEPPPAQGAT
jgi:proteasome beta subunit